MNLNMFRWIFLAFLFHPCVVIGGPNPKLPIVFVHGMLASGDTFAGQLARFEANGYDRSLLHLFDWNSLSFARGAALEEMDAFVDSIRVKAGVSKVYLVGHSAGSGLVYSYCNDFVRTEKVKGVVLLGGYAHDAAAGHLHEIPTLNIYSTADLVVKGGGDISGATNVRLVNEDHYEVATGVSPFNSMYQFITGEHIFISDALFVDNKLLLGGKAVTLGDNTPLRGGNVQVFQVDPASGKRLRKKPDAQFTVDHLGHWGPMVATRNACYEFVARGTGDYSKSIHYFREKITATNLNIYLRVIPTSGMLSMMFSGLPSDTCPALAVFSASKAIINDRDSIFVGGVQLTGRDFFKPYRTTIAAFLYDGNKNGNSDLNGIGVFNLQGIFLAGIDMYFSPGKKPIQLNFNGRVLNVPVIPSSQGITVPVFD